MTREMLNAHVDCVVTIKKTRKYTNEDIAKMSRDLYPRWKVCLLESATAL